MGPTVAADRPVAARIGLASLLLTVNWTTYVWAIVNDRVIETALGYFLAPLGTMALGVVVLGERLTPLKRASIGFAVAAVVVLAAAPAQAQSLPPLPELPLDTYEPAVREPIAAAYEKALEDPEDAARNG